MTKEYIIQDIVHSGRKGLRGTKVTHPKYMGLINCRIICDFDNCEQFKPFHWDFVMNFQYDYWDTSEVFALAKDEKNNELLLETVNTIYVFKEV